MLKRLFFFFGFLSCFAQEPVDVVPPQPSPFEESYWKFHHAAYTGYRRDRQSFTADGNGLLQYKTHYSNRNSVQVMIASHAEFKDIITYVRGSYGWLINGDAHFRVTGTSPPLPFPSFDLGAGYTAEVKGSVMYRWKWYDVPDFGFSFLPGLGYRYASMMNFSEGEERYSIPGTSNFAIASLPNPNHQDWFGPFADARFELRFAQFCEWLFSCQYHQPYLVSKSKYQVENYQYAGSLSSDQLSTLNSVLKAPSAHMILGMTDLKFHYGTGWTLGINFEGASTWSKKGTDRIHLKQEQFVSASETVTKASSRATVQWTFYCLSLMFGHTF